MRRMLWTCFALLTLMCSVVLSRAVFADDSVVDEIGIGVPISCTLSGTGMSSHTATIPNGIYSGSYTADGVDYTDGIGSTTLKAMCNDNEGFAIYAAGYTGDEIGGTNSTNLVGTSASGNSIIATGTATGPVGSDDISNWAMKLDTITSPAPTYPITIDGGFDDYSAVPSSYTKVAHRDSATDIGPNGVGSTLTTTYAAYISKTQPADTYSGKVIYTLVHPSNEGAPLHPETTRAGKICYYPNGSNVEGTMGCQTISASATSATLLASNFSRDGYGFAGWSKTFDYSDPTGFLGPQEYITFTAGEYSGNNNGLSLYAHWVKSEGNLQNWTCPDNATMPIGTVRALTDQRDNETYAIAKLADGKCWMIENLRLENTGTDNANGSLAQGYNSSFIGLADPETPWAINSTAANSLYTTESDIQGKNTISGSDQGYRFPRYNNTNTSARTEYESGQNVTTQNASIYSYGNYYTWPAAIADTTAYTSGNTSVTNTSICPTGWHLPKGGNNQNTANNEFLAFSEALIGAKPANYDSQTYPYYTGTPEGTDASNKLRAYPNNFVYSGYVNSGSVYHRGSYGYYWSSTAYSSNNAYYLYLNSSNVSPGTYSNSKYDGRAVRCVAPGA